MKPKTLDPIEPLYKAHAVKRVLNCSLAKVYRLVEEGLLPCVRIPCPGEGTKKQRTLVRFRRKDIVDFVEKHYKK